MVKDLAGKRFGRLIVVSAAAPGNSGHKNWRCRCDCGNEHTVRATHLLHGAVNSCGCLHREDCGKRFRTHGLRRTPEYRNWAGMLDRCRNPSNPRFARYGGRGITVCERWQSFEAFIADVGPRPSPKHSIDRFPDKDGNYEPSNCRWATNTQQSRNKSNNHLVTALGKTQTVAEWQEESGIGGSTILNRLRNGWAADEAITTPPRGRMVKCPS